MTTQAKPVPPKGRLVDLSSINAAESLFHPGVSDPWGLHMAGYLADAFIYSDVLRFPLPQPKDREPTLTQIVLDLKRRDPDVLVPDNYLVEEHRQVSTIHLEPAFDGLAAWARNNTAALRQLVAAHKENWVNGPHEVQFSGRLLYNADELKRLEKLAPLATQLRLPEDDLCYVFDLLLRYPLYGEMAGEGNYYLAHPFRQQVEIPTLEHSVGVLPSVPVSFRQSVSEIVQHLTLDEYTSFLHEARNVVREMQIHELKPGAVSRDALRELAARLELAPSLKAKPRVAVVLGAGISVAGTLLALGPMGAVAGAAVSIAATFWTGRLPRSASRIGWLRWAVQWSIESQGQDPSSR